MKRVRLRELGITIGRRPTGPHNAITDVLGVQVGHATLVRGEGRRAVRTGVTAVRPNGGDIFTSRVLGGAFVLNGAGEMSGMIQVQEWGLIETPILLTNTLSVGTVSAAVVQYMVDRYPGIGTDHDVIIPLVGECDDSYLNDITGGAVGVEDVYAALDDCTAGPVDEGAVGGGTGMVAFGFKGGIGTSSRVLAPDEGAYTVGVLVMANFGDPADLRIDGLPIGPHIAHLAAPPRKRYGSIIAVVATDAPLGNHALDRLCKRVALGIGRVGSYAAHGSGEIVLGFSTANTVPRHPAARTFTLELLAAYAMDPLYQAAIEATEEAILNAMCLAVDTVGFAGNRVPALPLDAIGELYHRYRGAVPDAPAR